jgi:hypothetical protein
VAAVGRQRAGQQFKKLRRLSERDRREKLEAGWSIDESHDHLIPPGWIKGPDYMPAPPREEIDIDALYQ